jgi:L-threonylcarbamoyladenylate synthase
MPDRLPAWRITQIAAAMFDGAVIAYPAEGVWGLGCVPAIDHAVARILAAKRRPWEMGLILVAGELSQIDPYLEGLAESQRNTLVQTWPSPVTFLVPDNGVAPMWIKGRHDRVALRVSEQPVISQICRALGGPIVSTSANPSGRPSAQNALRVRQYFADQVDYVIPGRLSQQGASEIRDLVSGEVVRSAGSA